MTRSSKCQSSGKWARNCSKKMRLMKSASSRRPSCSLLSGSPATCSTSPTSCQSPSTAPPAATRTLPGRALTAKKAPVAETHTRERSTAASRKITQMRSANRRTCPSRPLKMITSPRSSCKMTTRCVNRSGNATLLSARGARHSLLQSRMRCLKRRYK